MSLAVDNTQLELPGGVTSVESAADLGYDVAANSVFDTALLRNGDAIRRFDPRYVPDTQTSKRPDLKPKDGDIARVPDTWGSLALSVDGKQVAAVSADRRDLSIWRATEPTRSVASFATSLTQPTYDANGYLWIAGTDDRGNDHVYVLDSVSSDPKSAPKPIKTPWLGNRRVKALAVSADAARVLIVTTDRSRRRRAAGPQRDRPGHEQRAGGPVAAAAPGPVADPHPGRHVAGPRSNYAVLGQVGANDAVRPWLATLGAGVDGTSPGIGRLNAVPGRREHHDRRRTPRHPHRHERPPRAGPGRIQLAADRAGQRRARPRRLTPPVGRLGVGAGRRFSGFRSASTSPRCDTPSSPDPADGLTSPRAVRSAGLVAGARRDRTDRSAEAS